MDEKEIENVTAAIAKVERDIDGVVEELKATDKTDVKTIDYLRAEKATLRAKEETLRAKEATLRARVETLSTKEENLRAEEVELRKAMASGEK